MGNEQSSSSRGASSARESRMGAASASFRAFRDVYSDFGKLQSDLRRAGLESSNLIIGIDFTKSNEWTGRQTFGGRCLHAISPDPNVLNPYEQAISVIGQSLSPFDEDGLIPAFGFGCARTHDSSVFSLAPGGAPCNGFADVLGRYRAAVQTTVLAGPTSFGPLIRKACQIVHSSGGQYHILVIVADGQVTRPSDLRDSELSAQEQDTIAAIVEACAYPLSIVMVGVGDGPWDVMRAFDDKLPQRPFDNFQFVPMSETITRAARSVPAGAPPAVVKSTMDATFALQALMEVPEQYREITRLKRMGPAAMARLRPVAVPCLDPLAPAVQMPPPGAGGWGAAPGSPPGGYVQVMGPQGPMWVPAGGGGAPGPMVYGPPGGGYPSPGAGHPGGYPSPGAAPPGYPSPGAAPPGYGGPAPPPAAAHYAATAAPGFGDPVKPGAGAGGAPAAPGPASGAAGGGAGGPPSECAICMERPRDTAFACGHVTCSVCAAAMADCPVCRAPITVRIKLFQ